MNFSLSKGHIQLLGEAGSVPAVLTPDPLRLRENQKIQGC